jgi:hypothetical protein
MPWAEMFVTSAWEVRLPRVADLIPSLLNQAPCRAEQRLTHSEILREFDRRFEPELGLPALTLNMNVQSRLLP